MLFRRISGHVRRQDWTAVLLDFLIVVLGVFIGIQASNWNAARVEQQEEAVILQRLQRDFQKIEADARRSVEFHEQAVAAMQVVVRSLHAGMLSPDDRARFELGLRIGDGYATSSDRSSTLTGILASGQVGLIGDDGLVDQLAAYNSFVDRLDMAIGLIMGQ